MASQTIQAVGSKNHHYLTLNVWEIDGSSNIANNTTNVSFEFKLSPKNTGYNWSGYGTMSYTVTINGTAYSGKLPTSYDGRSTIIVASGYNIPITHDNDGNKTIGISFSVTDTSSASYTTGSANSSGTLTLSYIPRASKLNNASITLGETGTITWTKYSTFTHELKYKIGDIEESIPVNDDQVSATLTPPMSLASIIPTATGEATLTLTTKNGSSTIGTSTSKLTLTVPETPETRPTVTCTVEDTNPDIANKFGKIIIGQSKVTYNISAVSYNGATIESYKMEINGETINAKTGTTNTIIQNALGLATATDSRGYSKSVITRNASLTYSAPTLEATVERNEDIPSKLEIKYKATVYSLEEKNDKALKVKYKLQDESTWTELTFGSFVLNAEETMYEANSTYIITGLSEDDEYDVVVYLEDYFYKGTTAVTKPFKIGSAFVLMDYYADGTGIAFGKVAQESNTIDVGDNITFKYHGEEITTDIPQVVEEYTESNTDTYTCNYVNEVIDLLTPKVLYNNSSGVKTGTIPLNDSIYNYKKIDIFVRVGQYNNTLTLYTENIYTNPLQPLYTMWRDGTGAIGYMTSWWTINATTFVYKDSIRWYQYGSGTTPTIDNNNNVTVYKVVGYKY